MRHTDLGQHASELPSSPLFAALPISELEGLLEVAHLQVFPRDATLIAQGNAPNVLIVLILGRVKEQYLTSDGRELILDIWGPGDTVSPLPIVEGESALTSIMALEQVTALLVPGAELRRLLKSSPHLASVCLQSLSQRLRSADVERIELMSCDTTVRMCRRLLELARRWGRPLDDGIEINLPVSQAGLAARAGASREAAVKSLQTLRERGLIRTSRRRIEIVDFEGLRRRAYN